MSKATNGFNWRVASVNILFTALAVFSGSIAYAAGNVGSPWDEKLVKFTPADLKITPPGADVPAECAKFSGQWGPGLVAYISMATKVIFERIAPDCSATVVVVSALDREFGNDPGAWAGRHDVKIVQGAVEIQGVNGGNVLYALKMNSSGSALEGSTSKGLLRPISLELPR